MYGHSKRLLVVVAFLLVASVCEGARIKEIAFIDGARKNYLVGYGLVVGLDGTGDKTGSVQTTTSIANMLRRFGITLDPDDLRLKNAAAVMVTAELPPFVAPGARIDVLVSSIGDAKSLQGGTLIATPLKGPDGRVYAVAQGPVSIGGFLASGKGARVAKNHQTAGRIPNGAIVERRVPLDLASGGGLSLILKEPDFTTARRIEDAINRAFGSTVAQALNSGTIRLSMPEELETRPVEFIASIERLVVEADTPSKVVINEKTGTIVMGENVSISTVAISHGDITVEISTQYLISQPTPFSEGETVVQPQQEVVVEEEQTRLVLLPESVTLGDVVRMLNLVGVTPRDLIAILQAIKAAGALKAELEII